jgi:hypothetical protein
MNTLLQRLQDASEGSRAYALLNQAGHSPAKALEIKIDAERGCSLAIALIAALRAKDEL